MLKRGLRVPAGRGVASLAALTVVAGALVFAPASESLASTPTYSSAVIADAPTFYYRFGEAAAATTAVDSSGHGHDAAYQSAATAGVAGAVPGEPDTAVSGDGSGPIAIAPGADLPWGASPRTVELWEQTTTTTEQSLVSWGEAYHGGMLFTVTMTGSGGGSSTVTLHDDGSDPKWTVPVALADGGWHHIALTYDGSTTATLYVDGVTEGVLSTGGGLSTGVYYNPQRLVIGGDALVPATYASFAGSLDEVTVYATALSPAQIDNHVAYSGYPPATVTNVNAAAAGDPNTISVSWSEVATSPSSYDLRVLDGSGAVVDSTRVDAGTSCASGTCSTVVRGVSATGGPYTVGVSGRNAWGDGPESASSAVTPASGVATYRDAVLGDSPSFYYRLDARDDGDAAFDSAGGHTTVLQASAMPGVAGALAGDSDGAVGGNGSAPIAIADGADLPWGANARTVELWEQTTTTTEQSLVSWGEAYHGGMLFTLTMTGGGSGSSTVTLHDDGSDPSWTVPLALADGGWHNLALTYDGSTSLTLYVDGVTEGIVSTGGTLSTGVYYNPKRLVIGGDALMPAAYANFTGSLDEVAIYPSALSPGQVDNHLAHSGYPPSAPSSVDATPGTGGATVDVAWSTSSSGQPSAYDVRVFDGSGAVVDSTRVDAGSQCSAGSCNTVVQGVSAADGPYTVGVSGRNAWGDGPEALSSAVTPSSGSTTYRDAVIADSPTFYYRLDARNDGDAVPDSTTGHHDTVLQASATPGASGALLGDTDTAITGDGSAPIAIADGADLPWGSAARTVELWARTQTTTEQTLVSWGEAYSTDMLFTLTMTGAASGASTVTLHDAGDDPTWSVPVALADGSWHDVALTYDGSTTVTLYVDGVDEGPQSTASPSTGTVLATGVYYNPKRLVIGGDALSPATYASFSGSLDELAIYPAALSSSRMTAHFEAARSYALTVKTATGTGDGTGTFTCSVNGGAAGACASSYPEGSSVAITATPDLTGYLPVWTGCDSVTADSVTCTVSMGAARAIDVEFVQAHTLTASVYSADKVGNGVVRSSVGSISCPDVTCSEEVPYSNGAPGVVTLNAVPDSASYLSGWNGCDDNTQVTCQVTVDSDKTVTASFLNCPTGFTCNPFTGPATTFSAVCPAGGDTAGGSLVTLTGTDLLASDQVLFDGQPATAVSASPDGSSLTVRAPAHAAGTVTVTIQGLNGSSKSFTYENTPAHLTGVEPNAVLHVGAGSVTLTGTNLFDVTEIDTGTDQATNLHASCDGTSVTFTPADDTTVSDTSQSVFVTTAAGQADNTVSLGRMDPLDQGPTSSAYAPDSQFLLDANSASQPETFAYSAADGSGVDATVPAGALPVGTRLDVYKVDPSDSGLTSSLPAGSIVKTGYAIAWTAPDGSHPDPTLPIQVTISDPDITPNQTVYAAGDDGNLSPLSLTATVPAGVDKLAIVDGQDQHIVDLIDVTPGEQISGAQVIAAGGGNVIAAGGGNLVLAGGFVIAAGGGNVIAAGGGNVIAAGGGNVIAAGGGNFQVLAATAAAMAQINASAAGVIAAGGGNLGFNFSSLVNVSGAGFATMSMPGDPQFVMADAPTAPAAPGTPDATASGTSATVSWTAPPTSTPAVSEYAVQIYQDGAKIATDIFGSSAVSQTIDNLASGHQYTFTVEAYNGAYSAPSAASAAIAIGGAGGGGGGGGAAGGGGGTAGGAAPTGVNRVSGATRVETAIAASKAQYPTAGSARAVVVARADVFADALAGGPLAAKVGGPLLLTGSSSLDVATKAEIERVLPTGSTVFVLGGTRALSPDVEQSIVALGDTVSRVYGDDRYGTAVAIAKTIGNPSTVFVVTGANFPDALSAGPAAVVTGGVVLLSSGSSMVPATSSYLSSLGNPTVYAVGGPACTADPSATCLKGADRYATSATVAAKFFAVPADVGVATGTNFPDALSAAAYLGSQSAPLLLVSPSGNLPSSVSAYLASTSAAGAEIFGGVAAISDAVLANVRSAMNLS